MKFLQHKIDEGEHQQQDFKFQITDSRKIARTLSAFANTDGGRLLVGIKDNGKISGVRSDEEIHMIEGAAELYSSPAIPVEYQQHKIEGKLVLEAIVQPSESKPHFVLEKNQKRIAYFRKDDENFPACNVLLKYWNLKNGEPKSVAIKEKETLLLNFLQDHPYITVKKFSNLAKISFQKSEDLLALFLSWNVIAWRFNGRFFEFELNELD